MGVYHFMGLGRSVGTVTGPISYLAMKFKRWNTDDRTLFGPAGEHEQRQRREKVGDIQALVVFTSPEVFCGEDQRFWCYPYIENQPGCCPPTGVAQKPARPMREALRDLLPREWKPIAKGRKEASVFWCEVDRTDLLATFERVSEVVLAAKAPGALGKEVWMNLTGGNNVVNLALQLSATLTGQPARFYYVQAENLIAEKCVRYTREEGYWVNLPLLPITANKTSRALIEVVEGLGAVTVDKLRQRLCERQEYWSLFQDLGTLGALEQNYLRPLIQQGLLEREGNRVGVGRSWEALQPYYKTLDALGEPHEHLERLAGEREWLHVEKLCLS